MCRFVWKGSPALVTNPLLYALGRRVGHLSIAQGKRAQLLQVTQRSDACISALGVALAVWQRGMRANVQIG